MPAMLVALGRHSEQRKDSKQEPGHASLDVQLTTPTPWMTRSQHIRGANVAEGQVMMATCPRAQGYLT